MVLFKSIGLIKFKGFLFKFKFVQIQTVVLLKNASLELLLKMVDQYAGCRLWAKQAVNAGRVSTETGKVGGVCFL